MYLSGFVWGKKQHLLPALHSVNAEQSEGRKNVRVGDGRAQRLSWVDSGGLVVLWNALT